jgi:hypothetical protein
MEAHIYQIPSHDIIDITCDQIKFSSDPGPKLLRYGYNDIFKKLDIVNIISDEHHRVGLCMDHKKIKKHGDQQLNVKNYNQVLAEVWEVIVLMNLTEYNLNIVSKRDELVSDLTKKMKGTKQLVMAIFSDIDLHEDSLITLLLSNITDFLSKVKKLDSLILQIFDCQTPLMTEIIYVLSTLFDSTYIVRASATPCINTVRYLVLIGYKGTSITVPKVPSKKYYSSIFEGEIPKGITDKIQCLNADVTPNRYIRLVKMKTYLEKKIFDGVMYKNMLAVQEMNEQKWFSTFTKPDKNDIISNKALETSNRICDYSGQLDAIY